MDLKVLHVAVRSLVRDGHSSVGREGMPAIQQAAFQTLKRNLHRTGGNTEQLASMARGWDWMSPTPRNGTVQ